MIITAPNPRDRFYLLSLRDKVTTVPLNPLSPRERVRVRGAEKLML
jgi:hypothetical protein